MRTPAPALILLVSVTLPAAEPAAPLPQVRADFQRSLGPIALEDMALGQGGLSEEPMFESRTAEIQALGPRFLRLFLQEYFDLLPERGRYSFETFDRALDTVRATGATPLLSICFKPRVLFPEVRQETVEPNDWGAWEALVEALVRHAAGRGARGIWWEVANEPDIGESGGCPYLFTPANYVPYYRRTAAAVLRGDPEARVGGPALASVDSPIFPALLEAADREKLPLHFVSWHIYSSDPRAIAATVDRARALLKRHPALRPATVLDEWNMDLMNPPADRRFQPCHIAETIWRMKDAGLDISCYYQIRDRHVSYETFARFMSPGGTAFMTRWWNRAPQYDGLFDFQDAVRPAFFAFKLLSRLRGERLALESDCPAVRGFLARDDRLGVHSLLLWNFSYQPVRIELVLSGVPRDLRWRSVVLDALTPAGDEDSRLRHLPAGQWKAGEGRMPVDLEPWGLRSWTAE